MKLKSVMQHDFSTIEKINVPRSSFNRNHGYKTTFDAGYLIPVFTDLMYPGDTANLQMTSFARLATPTVPILDNLHMDTFFFSVPIRLIFDNFKAMLGEQEPDTFTDYTFPTMTAPTTTGYAVGSLSDYLGIPTEIDGFSHVSLFHRAYAKIWNDWFRDENLQDSIVVDTDDGPDDPADYALQKRGKRKDYFTSCLPWAQKGTALTLPLGTYAPVVTNGNTPLFDSTDAASTSQSLASAAPDGFLYMSAGAATNKVWEWGSETGLRADLANATAATINQWREQLQYQALLEIDARSGTRYNEVVLGHFGVVVPDYRVQRSEYLGGGTNPVQVIPVPQSSGSDISGQSTPQGNLAGYGTSVVHRNGFIKSFNEHCIVIGLVSVRADLTYQQGLPRLFIDTTKNDLYWPALAHLGEQPVTNKEIYLQGTSADDDTFGYQEIYSHLRFKNSLITGKMRSYIASGSLDVWHLSQEFGSLPTLNSTFIEETPPMSRIKAVTTEPDFIFDAYFDYNHVRPIPTHGTPRSLMRF